MAKRKKKHEITGVAKGTVEERLARLEGLLAERDTLISRQAAVIVLAAEAAEELRQSREEVERLKVRAEASKRAASEAKKSHEAAVEEHFRLERDLSSGQQKLPFPPEPEVPERAAAAASDAETPESPAGGDSSWRDADVASLDLTPGLLGKLRGRGMATIGDLSDYLQPTGSGYCRRLTDIPGIGEAAAERISEALAAFWESDAAAEDVNQELLEGVREAEGDNPDYSGNGEWESSEPEPEGEPIDVEFVEVEPGDD